ncbi:MAG: response regulator [Deltaproteobacteria bacterium]|nr:response regulator [Deltaproteobacteria bacterium]
MDAKRILIVDDEINMCSIIQDILTDEGYEVMIAENGSEALQVVRKITPDLIITDINMPCMGGLELLREVKSLHTDIQFIVMTAFGELETYLNAMSNGAFDYITKPLNIEMLKIMVAKVLGQGGYMSEGITQRN